MKSLRLPTLFSFLLLASACAITTTRTHPELNEQLQHIDTVVIAPPRVEITQLTLTGENERLLELERMIRQELVALAEARLRERGFEVLPFDFDAAMQENDEFAYTVTQIREGFEKAKEDLQLGQPIAPEKANKLAVSLGEATNIVAARTGADAILLLRYQGFDKSSGYVAKDVATSVLVAVLTAGQIVPYKPAEGAITEAALVDGATGEVLWADIKGGKLNAAIAGNTMDTLPQDMDPD